MRNKSVQMSLFDTYKDVAASMDEDKPKLFRLLDEHIDWDTIIPARFYMAFMAFYQNTGRPRKYPLTAFLKSLVLQKIFGYVNDSVLLVTLRHSREMRRFCGFYKVPDAAKLTRFKQDFLPYIMEVFERLVELTEPICQEMDAELAGCLIYDTTEIESYVAENNPKFFSSKLRQAKTMEKANPDTNPYRAMYGLLPDCAAANPVVRQQYINSHFCYAQKAGILTNDLGIVRHIAFFDDASKKAHPEIPIDKCTDDPDAGKELGNSRTLLPVLRDFSGKHPALRYSTFLGDAAFGSYDTYRALLKERGFTRAVIPMNHRNSAGKRDTLLDESGVPLCPHDGTQLKFHSVCGGKTAQTASNLSVQSPSPIKRLPAVPCAAPARTLVPALNTAAAFTSTRTAISASIPASCAAPHSGMISTPNELLLNALLAPSNTFSACSKEKLPIP